MPSRSECNCNGYKNAHALVRRHLLKLYPERCMFCGSTHVIEAANVSDDPFSRNKRDYILLCKRCHIVMDGHDHNLAQGKEKNEKAHKERLLGLKTCPRCDATKKVEEFRKDKSRKYGRWPYCIECERKINREKYTSRRKVNGWPS